MWFIKMNAHSFSLNIIKIDMILNALFVHAYLTIFSLVVLNTKY